MLNLKTIWIILLTNILLASCLGELSDKSEEFITGKVDSSFVEIENINGIWGMESYFDSINSNKKISLYRNQPATWFAFLLEIRVDSIINYGSINDGIVARNDSDTLAKFESMSGQWILLNRNPSLHLINIAQKYVTLDSNTYVFRKRDDLKFLTQNLRRKRMKLDSNITDYFNKQILAGEYSLNNEKVILKSDGTVSGLFKYTNYKIWNYFGTLHSFNNNPDVVYFSNEQIEDWWSWGFSDSILNLTKLKADWEKTDKYWPTEEKIILKKN